MNHFIKNENENENGKYFLDEIMTSNIAMTLFRNIDDVDENILDDFSDLPEKIIIQAKVVPTFHTCENTYVKGIDATSSYAVYDKDYGVINKALSKLQLIGENFISDELKDFHTNIFKDQILFEKTFDVLKPGVYKPTLEKRSPRENIPEQSLWSYGAIYTSDFDVCQLVQTNFFALTIGFETKIRFVHDQTQQSVGQSVQNGAIKIPIDKDFEGIYYQSFFIKNITPTAVHIHLEKVLSHKFS